MSDDSVIREVSDILLNRNVDKPWMTATGLSRHLTDEYGRCIKPDELESILERYARKQGRRIRYSYYPSKRTLDILWGHTDKVGEQRYLPALERLDEPTEYTASPVCENARWFLISHNHRDLGRVIELRKTLIAKGYGVWIFESEIPQGNQIPAAVREAIDQCEIFISYVSTRSIGSLWVQKEIEAVEAALEKGAKALGLFVDGEDVELLNLLNIWGEMGPSGPKGCYELGREPHRNADYTVGLVPSRSPFPAFLSSF
jgi:TIR domain